LRAGALFTGLFAGLCLCLGPVVPANAQGFDPRPALGQIISAFQNCGPPQAYQILSPTVFQAVAQQTGGTGCYAPIRAAGPVRSMQVVDQRQFPIGPLYVVRVTHPGGPVDWFIGFNQFSGQVEYLTFQPAQTQQPTITTGPAPGAGGPTPTPEPTPRPAPPSGTDEGCTLYPAMCQ